MFVQRFELPVYLPHKSAKADIEQILRDFSGKRLLIFAFIDVNFAVQTVENIMCDVE